MKSSQREAISNKNQTTFRGKMNKKHIVDFEHSKILAEMNMDLDTVIAGLLHDTLEDTDTTYDEIKSLFWRGKLLFLLMV